MKKIIVSLMAFVAMLSANAQEGTLAIKNLQYAKGETGSFELWVKTDVAEYSQMQFCLYLTPGTVLPGDDDDEDTVTPVLNKKTLGWTVTPNASGAPDLAGYDKYMVTAVDMSNKVWASTEETKMCTFNILPSQPDKIKVIIKDIVISHNTGAADKEINIAEISASTDIIGIAADEAKATNDGKFVENNRVVIKKAGVKYSTTGQVIK